MRKTLLELLKKSVEKLGISRDLVTLAYTEDLTHGDMVSNIAMVVAKGNSKKPHQLAKEIVDELNKDIPEGVKSIDIAGPGFINFTLEDSHVVKMLFDKPKYRGITSVDEPIMVEYTDPNPFKEFHIGHLMSNAIGESISRLIELGGAKVIRANWQGDVGPHVAKAIWGAKNLDKKDFQSPSAFWGQAYVIGAKAYEENAQAKTAIEDINKKIYDGNDLDINVLYESGRRECLEAFEKIYKRLGTKFDNYFFEGIEGRNGEEIVRKHIEKGVFEESEGAIIFHGERYGLHTRVFITSRGLPTYECKELGLNTEKFKLYPNLAKSIIITANEQNDYFKVLLKVLSFIDSSIAQKTEHIGHGMMRFASGKMSSRKGNVISGEGLIDEIKTLVLQKMANNKDLNKGEKEEIADQVAVAAIKYTILRQSIGSDIIFDSAKSISFEGDSGPYLQYSAVRAAAVLKKAKEEMIDTKESYKAEVGKLERLLIRFEDIIERAKSEYAPQLVANYLMTVAGEFNSFYNRQIIVSKTDPSSAYYVALTKKFHEVMSDGLWLLGIKIPAKM